ncbi:hypothetical protein ACI65C_002419 [Semiaphis heraclei]
MRGNRVPFLENFYSTRHYTTQQQQQYPTTMTTTTTYYSTSIARNESVLRCDRNDTRSSAERHIRVHDSGEPVSASRTDDAIVNNFFPPSVGGGGGCVDDDGPTRIYAAHHRGTPCAAATSRVH